MPNRAQQWDDNLELSLPSGKTVEVVEPNIFSLVSDTGAIPNFLREILEDRLSGKEAPSEAPSITLEDIAKTGDFVDNLIMQCWVSPVVVNGKADADADEIHVNRIGGSDKMYFLEWALKQLGVTGVALVGANKSAGEQSNGIPTLGDVAGVPADTEFTAGDD